MAAYNSEITLLKSLIILSLENYFYRIKYDQYTSYKLTNKIIFVVSKKALTRHIQNADCRPLKTIKIAHNLANKLLRDISVRPEPLLTHDFNLQFVGYF